MGLSLSFAADKGVAILCGTCAPPVHFKIPGLAGVSSHSYPVIVACLLGLPKDWSQTLQGKTNRLTGTLGLAFPCWRPLFPQ